MTPIILVLMVGASDSADPFATSVERAVHQALGPDTRVVARPLAARPTDADAATLGAEVHADAVVEVLWSEPDHLRATIRVERTNAERWLERDIGFRDLDEPVERSRTVGFTVASMLPEFVHEAAPAPSEAPPRAPPPESDRRRTAREPTDSAGSRPANTLTGSASAAFGVHDYGTSVGGAVDFRHALGAHLSVEMGAGARAGQNPPAQAVTRFYFAAVGLAWNTWTSENARGALGLRLDSLLMVADFSRTTAPDGSTENILKSMPGARLLAETSYFFAAGAAVALSGGGEAVFGKTDVFVGTRRVASYAPLHPVVELGLRVAF